MKRNEAIRMRQIIENAAQSLPDKEASEAPTLFPGLTYDGALIPAGTRIHWNGALKRAAVDLWSIEENNPDNAPTLWEDIEYKKGYRIIPPVITVGTAFAKDECGWWGDVLYQSLLDANAHTPEQYPAGWEEMNG